MKTIQLVQVNYQYGSNAYLPYSVGCLESSLRTNTELASHVVFRQPIFERHPISEQIKRIGSVDVLGLSCYIWNWEYSKALGRLYREHHPHALILVGGPQVPLHNRNLFTTDLDFADLAVVGEGEVAFSQVIENFVYGRSFKEIPGLLLPSGLLRSTVSTGEPIRIDDVASLPSPYTSGVFDQLISGYPELDFQVSQETHRGCPYSCTFCD